MTYPIPPTDPLAPPLRVVENAIASFIALDTETGGLDERLNPLLSIALVTADAELNEIDGFDLKIAPPHGTVLEIPVQHEQDGITKKKRISHLMDVWTGESIARNAYDYDRPLITAYAAEVNGYVSVVPGVGWDLQAIEAWNTHGLSVQQAELTMCQYIRQAFETKPVAIAHNADFDRKFIGKHMPVFFSDLFHEWYCTCNSLRAYYKRNRIKGERANLATGCKQAGYDIEKYAHEALADTRGCLLLAKWLQMQEKAEKADSGA